MTLTITHPDQGRRAAVNAAIGTFVVGALAFGGYQIAPVFDDGSTASVGAAAVTPAVVANPAPITHSGGTQLPSAVVGAAGVPAVVANPAPITHSGAQAIPSVAPGIDVAPQAAASALLSEDAFRAAVEEGLAQYDANSTESSGGHSTPASGPR